MTFLKKFTIHAALPADISTATAVELASRLCASAAGLLVGAPPDHPAGPLDEERFGFCAVLVLKLAVEIAVAELGGEMRALEIELNDGKEPIHLPSLEAWSKPSRRRSRNRWDIIRPRRRRTH